MQSNNVHNYGYVSILIHVQSITNTIIIMHAISYCVAFFLFLNGGNLLHSGQYQNLDCGGAESCRHSKWNHWYGHDELSHPIILPLSGPLQ